MATRTDTVRYRGDVVGDYLPAAAGGFVAGVLSGLFLWAVSPTVLAEAIPATYGLGGSLAAGWAVHLAHATAFGLLYGGLVDLANRETSASKLGTGAVYGLAYGALLWLLVAVTFVPLAMPALGYAAAPAFPYVDATAFAAYAGFGLVVGVASPLFARAL